jgi:hypothetical protein
VGNHIGKLDILLINITQLLENLEVKKWFEYENRIRNKTGHGRKKLLNSYEERPIVWNMKQNPQVSTP